MGKIGGCPVCSGFHMFTDEQCPPMRRVRVVVEVTVEARSVEQARDDVMRALRAPNMDAIAFTEGE
jgi:hypothetical protein